MLGATAGTGAWNGSTTSIRAATSSSDPNRLVRHDRLSTVESWPKLFRVLGVAAQAYRRGGLELKRMTVRGDQ